MSFKKSFYPLLYRFIACILCLCLSIQALAQTLTATVDRDTIKSDETLTLTLTYNATTNSQPDTTDLTSQFDILSQRQSSSTRYVNGDVSSSTNWVYTLQPQKIGKLMIPSFNFGGGVSDAIVVNVEEPVYQSSQTGEDLFFITEISKKEAYVQEQILLSYKLFHKIQFDVVSHTLADLEIDDTVYEPLENTTYQTTINNERYQVQEINYAFFAQASGSLEIPSIKWVFRTRIDRSNRYEIKRVQTDALQLKIKSVPASFPVGATWLPASNITIRETWSSALNTLKIGEPSTRTLTLEASGLSAVQLPELTPSSQSTAYSIYPETPETNQSISRMGINAIRQEKSAIVINMGGNIILSEIAIPWWNTLTDELEYATIEQKNIQIVGAPLPNTPQNAAPALTQETRTATPSEQGLNNNNHTTQYKTSFIWPLISGVLLLISAVFFILWWRIKYTYLAANEENIQKSVKHQKEIKAFNAIIQSCRSHNAQQTKKDLCDWGRNYLNNAQSLAAIGGYIKSSDVFDALKELDECLYKSDKNNHWNGDKLSNALINWKKIVGSTSKDAQLAPLYPV